MAGISNASLQVGLARMEEQLKTIVRDNQDAKQARRDTYVKLEGVEQKIDSLEHRVKLVENTLIAAGPTLAEFGEFKFKMQGAGIAGRWLWAIGGVLIGTAFAMRETIRNWLNGI